MNKKIKIGLASVFLVLVLVLGIQMLTSEPVIAPERDLDQEQTGEDIPYQEQQSETTINEGNQPNFETPEPQPEDTIEPETPIEPELPIEPEDPVETPTDPIAPTEPETAQYITLSVSAKTLLDKKDTMNPGKWELVPQDGWIFPAQKVEFYEDESVFNVLLREMKKNKIHMEYVMTPIYNSNYIEGIGNLYEFDCGELSGWMYAVNDLSPSLGTSNYTLKDGDTVRLLYTCDLGRDLGFEVDE
jgi:hypothetical protein